MEDIVIIGNSGAARECHQLLYDSVWNSPSLRYSVRFKGFLSYGHYEADLGDLGSFFMGDLEDFEIAESQRFVIGVGAPDLRRKIFEELKGRGAKFFNLISPWSYLPPGCELGDGNIINSSCNFSGATRVGDGNYFNGQVRVGHDVTIGSFNFFAPCVTILGAARVGDGNLFAVQSVLLDRGKVGDNNHIAPGSIVYKGCSSHCRMGGNPALKIDDLRES